MINTELYSISPTDGLISISIQQFKSIRFMHLISNITLNESEFSPYYDNCYSRINGYTEWISDTKPIISLGWDWTTLIKKKGLVYIMQDHPYCNIQLVDKSHQNLPEIESHKLLKAHIDLLNWENTVSTHIMMKSTKYKYNEDSL